MITIHVDPKDVPQIIRATFPGYSGQKVQVQAASEVTISDLNWSGGTHSQYRACTLDGQWTGGMDAMNERAPWSNPAEGQTVPVPVGFCVVEHVIFCGKDLGLRVTVNPADMPRYLPSGDSELTDMEKLVLKIIRSYVSSYRREEWSRHGYAGWEYEELLTALKAKGLLTKQGGLTLAGRNAANNL